MVVYIWEIIDGLTEGQRDLPKEEQREQMKKHPITGKPSDG